MTDYFCEQAWLPGGLSQNVRVTADQAGTVTAVTTATTAQPGDDILRGVVLPGFANGHSHAFHRALRGRTHAAGGTFWTWRELMYRVATRLDPDTYRDLATAAYAEMALAGVSCVGEFHYLHHQPDGTPYDDPNAMAEALRQAAHAAGIRLTLLDACYIAGGIGKPLGASQVRFGDGDAASWADRAAALRPDATTRIGAAIHSVRAVPADQMATVVEAAAGRPLHVHVSEQPAENSQCQAAYGRTPTQLLHEHGALGPTSTAVHATHLTPGDVGLLGSTTTTVCLCPTTERDLADGIGPAGALYGAGCPLTLGSDQHAVVDLLEEARAMEMHERLATGERGRFIPTELVTALTVTGHASLGWPQAGRIAVGSPCDLVAIRVDTPRTAGAEPAQIVFTATAADVDTVVVGGRSVVSAGRHRVGDIGELLQAAIDALEVDRRIRD
ncbi:MAG: formimidoylglutamate deiminase [Jiangellaceae bacterium]|nr:formimidoylglutamate deiminase [Jiangellaceae bacterium]